MTIQINKPYEDTPYDFAKRELFNMEVRVRRMKHMIENGYYVKEYTDKEWINFKQYKNETRRI
jgi:hypothetical protein